jgi:cyanophycinase-like exopeptidase
MPCARSIPRQRCLSRAAKILTIQGWWKSSLTQRAFLLLAAINPTTFVSGKTLPCKTRSIATGKPIGGSSAGLAILGEFSFSSMIDTIHSPEALADPYGNKVTLTREFLHIPFLANTITDTHFVKRDRLGRLLVFMARILQDGWTKRVRAVAVEENAAVLVEPDGTAKVVGEGAVYFLESSTPPLVCAHKQPLTFAGISVLRVVSGQSFQLKNWQGQGDSYALSVDNGSVNSSSAAHSPY